MENQKNSQFSFLVQSIVIGLPAGIGTASLISLIISYIIHDGGYHPVHPALTAVSGSVLNAVLLQSSVSAIIGAVFSAAQTIWNQESWNLTQQTLLDFAVRFTAILTGGWMCRWYPHTAAGILRMTVIFSAVYFVIWLVQWLINYHRVQQINQILR